MSKNGKKWQNLTKEIDMWHAIFNKKKSTHNKIKLYRLSYNSKASTHTKKTVKDLYESLSINS